MPIYYGSSRKYSIGCTADGVKYPHIVKVGGGRVIQPGNGRVFVIGYPRTNLKKGSIPAYGQDTNIYKYIKGSGSQYAFGLSGTGLFFPNGWANMNTSIVGTNALSTSQVATQSGNVNFGGKSYPFYGFKVSRSGTTYIKIYVMISVFSGYTTPENHKVYAGYFNGTVSGKFTLSHKGNRLFVYEGGLNVGTVAYLTLPIIYTGTTFVSDNCFGVQSYYAFSTSS